MNPFPENDKPLTKFLKQYRPVVPLSPGNQEDQMMAAIEANLSPEEFVRRDRRLASGPSRQKTWLIPSAIAAGVIATLIGYKTFAPVPQPSPAEVAELEAFIESSWSTTVASDPSADRTYDQLLHVEDLPSSAY